MRHPPSPIRRCLGACALLGALLLAGCASVDPRAVEAQTRGRSIAVASVLGPDLQLHFIGSTRMLNGNLPVPYWAMDASASDSAITSLRATVRYGEVTPLDGVTARHDAAPVLPPGVRSDLALVITRGGAAERGPMFDPSKIQEFPGLGVYTRRGIDGPPTGAAYVGVRLRLIDVASGKTLASAAEADQWPVDPDSIATIDPTHEFGKVSGQILSPSGIEALREPMQQRLSEVIDRLLAKMGLR